MSGTPKPWRKGKWGASVVADQPNPERRPYSDIYPESKEVEDYGGYLVCESASPSDRATIVRDGNAHDKLVMALREAADRLDAAADLAENVLEADEVRRWASEARTIANGAA